MEPYRIASIDITLHATFAASTTAGLQVFDHMEMGMLIKIDTALRLEA
jgi:hypothetical protein